MRSRQALLEGMEVNLILTNAKVGHILLTWTPYAGDSCNSAFIQMSGS